MSNDTAIASLKEKIDDLNQQAWDVRVTDLPKSFELSQESVKLARSINYPKGLAEGLRSLGFSYVRYSKNDDAAPLLKESLSLFQSLNDLKGQAVIYEYLGIIERNWGNLGASLDLLLKANELVLQIGLPEIEITCSYQLGVTYKHLGDHENALDYLYKTLSLAKKMNFTLMEAYATNIIGSIYFDNGNYNQALDCYQQGLPIRKQSHDKWGEAGSLDNIGFTYLKLNDLDKAIDHCKQSLAICQATGDKKGEANALLHLGEIYEQAGDIKQAADFSNKSLEIRKERGDKRGETEVLLFLAELYKNRNDVEDRQIFEWLSNALKIADEVKAQDLLSKTYYELHEYYQQKGNFKESLVHLEAHFQIEKELHKNSINQKIANLEISHKAEIVGQRNKELTELNEKIKKANEELKIEASLEKVRARTMAMQRSDELADVAQLLFQQVKDLGIKAWTTGFNIWLPDNAGYIDWITGPTGDFLEPYTVDVTRHEVFAAVREARQRGDDFFVSFIEGKQVKQVYQLLSSFGDKGQFQKILDSGIQFPTHQYNHIVFGAQVSLLFVTYEPYPEAHDIFKRFGKVFEQTYTRFLDLKKAEAQARESQIEVALEKVRSRSLAMHTANELGEVVTVIVEKLKDLGVVLDANGVVLCTYFQNSKNVMHWIVSPDYSMAGHYLLPYFDHPIFNAALQSKENGDEYFSRAFSVEEKNSFFEHAFEHSDYRHFPDEFKQWIFQNDQHILSFAWQKNSAILIPSHTGVLPSEEDVAILKRFSKVFEQSYVRFLDLQKAEAQAKEAQIEASLDRIRAKAMAMHLSEEIDEVLEVLFDQFDVLGIVPMSTHLTLINLETNSFTFRETGKGGRKSFGEQTVPIDSMDIWKDAADKWRNMEPLSLNILHFPKESLPIVWQVFHESFASMPEGHKITPEDYPDGIYHTAGNCKFGYIGMNQVRPATEEEEQIVLKFAVEFGRLYQRYLDLQKAEAQTKEARIEAALERVRSRTMGMQKSEELKDVIQVVFEQFVHLNIHIEHTGFVMDYKAKDDYDIWIADKLGVPSHLIIPYFDSVYYNRFNEAKEKGENFFATNLDFEEKNRFYKKLLEYVPGIPEETKEFLFNVPGLAASTALLENVCLYIENFAGTPYSNEENATLMRFGKVFQQTYTRFKDLKLAEAHAVQAEEDLVKLQTEKKRAEDALSELQVTQKQLIQAEKMASLGELTAGIAHEIQNPLNFVNNFSDVNKELLAEMKEEIEKGNTEEVIAIANDIISNEEKINHHGKRADAIVKGMLQHSRSSSGIMEPTDINELVDEYLRLAYHGLRAKDKSFNATMKTDFDEAIGKVNVIPQDIGRVFLNLITNAFYVVAEKKKHTSTNSAPNGYEPTVTVTTKKGNDKVVVSVKDNGNGIPQKVLDKIFQPFFTTKPTGQGTGLGLSLSYDIVKAHGGEIKVKTKDGEGSEFVIQLPIGQ